MGKRVKVDAELRSQLERAATDNSSLGAVFVLRSDEVDSPPKPEETRATVRRIMASVEKAIGEPAQDVHVFPLLGSFVVQAKPRFLNGLLEQVDAIASATANEQKGADALLKRTLTK